MIIHREISWCIWVFLKESLWKEILHTYDRSMMIVQLNIDVLELIFKFLDFRSLCGKFSNIFLPFSLWTIAFCLNSKNVFPSIPFIDSNCNKYVNVSNIYIFSAAEMTCKLWKEVVNERRLYWQLSKHLCAQRIPKFLSNHSDSKNPSNRSLYTLKQFKKCNTKNDLPINCS